VTIIGISPATRPKKTPRAKKTPRTKKTTSAKRTVRAKRTISPTTSRTSRITSPRTTRTTRTTSRRIRIKNKTDARSEGDNREDSRQRNQKRRSGGGNRNRSGSGNRQNQESSSDYKPDERFERPRRPRKQDGTPADDTQTATESSASTVNEAAESAPENRAGMLPLPRLNLRPKRSKPRRHRQVGKFPGQCAGSHAEERGAETRGKASREEARAQGRPEAGIR